MFERAYKKKTTNLLHERDQGRVQQRQATDVVRTDACACPSASPKNIRVY